MKNRKRPNSQSDVRQSRTNREVTSEVVDSVASGIPGKSVDVQGRLVELEVRGQDEGLVVNRTCAKISISDARNTPYSHTETLRTVFEEELLAKEGEIARVPGVGGVHAAEDHDAERDTCRDRRERDDPPAKDDL